MDCAVNDIDIQQDDGTMRGVEIIPEGCKAVSEDVCASGYMAPAENVSFPKDSLSQCCKCMEGEKCEYCKDPDACTDEEKERYITNDDCFGEVVGPSPEESAGPSTEGDDDGDEKNENYLVYIGVGTTILILLTIVLFSVTRRPKTF